MTQEENAKAYTELINRLEDVKNAIKKQNYGIAIDILCKPYPEFQVTTHSELKDSEDKNIRKLLIEAVIQVLQDQYCSNRGVSKEKVVAWLEKQGNLMKALQISNAKIGELIEKNYYLKEQLEKQGNNMGISEVTKQELEDNLNKALEKETPESWNKFLEKQGEPQKHDVCDNCEQQGSCVSPCPMKLVEKQGEQKTVIKMKTPEESLGIDSDTYNKIVDECIYGEQKPAEIVKWSPEEESCICQLESLVKEQWRKAEKVHNSVNVKKMSELMFFLKTLNPNKKPQRIISAEAKEAMYDKPAWSEEDENEFNHVIETLKSVEEEQETKGYNNLIGSINWLKSLKDRVQPKQEWKPSDEQLKAIKWIMDGDSPENWTVTLANLYNDLKKLREG